MTEKRNESGMQLKHRCCQSVLINILLVFYPLELSSMEKKVLYNTCCRESKCKVGGPYTVGVNSSSIPFHSEYIKLCIVFQLNPEHI